MAYYGNGISNITTTKASVGTVAIAGLAVGLAAAGVVNAFNMEYFGGMKRSKSYKDIAKRNAALGWYFFQTIMSDMKAKSLEGAEQGRGDWRNALA